MDDKECSKLGGGFLWRVPAEDILKPVEEVKYNYEEQHNQQRQGVHETIGKCIGAWPELIEKYDLLKMLLKYKEEEKNFYYHSDLCGSRAQSQACLSYAETKQSVQSKHLGSAAYLTYGGNVFQTLNYLPYGEDWIDKNSLHPDDTTRLGIYRFNGKEKDYESGFHYYGARYYWSELLTGWLSVDPMADKYPSISPYVYCAWNPVRFVDSDGMKFDSISQIEVDKLKKQAVLNWYKGYMGDIESALNRNEYNSTLMELSQLELSNQNYHVPRHDGDFLVKGKWGAAGWTHYLVDSDVVEIEYNGHLGSLAHELKHSFQFEIGNISYDETGETGDVLYDFYDEREAYSRGAAFGRRVMSDEDISKIYSRPMTYTTVNSQPQRISITDLLVKRKNIYRKDGVTYKQK